MFFASKKNLHTQPTNKNKLHITPNDDFPLLAAFSFHRSIVDLLTGYQLIVDPCLLFLK